MQRTVLSLNLDEEQKKALLKHHIALYDTLTDEELDNFTKHMEIPEIFNYKDHPIMTNTNIYTYTCGIDSVDTKISPFLGGCITEICGLPGSGRTTLCLRYAARLGPEGRTLWIDTEGCLNPPKDLKIHSLRILDHLQFFGLTYRLPAIVSEFQPNLIVVDSIAATLRGQASTEATTRTALLGDLIKVLKKIAAGSGIAVLITNHLSKQQFHGFIRTLGQSWSLAPTHCFELKKFAGSRIIRVLKSPCIPRIDISLTEDPDEPV